MYSTSNLDILRDRPLDLVICLNPTSSLHPHARWNPLEWGTRLVRNGTGRRLGYEAKTMRERGTEVVLIQPLAEDLGAMGSQPDEPPQPAPHSGGRHRNGETATQRAAQRRAAREAPKASRPEKIHRPAGPPSEWPSLRIEDLRPRLAALQGNGGWGRARDPA